MANKKSNLEQPKTTITVQANDSNNDENNTEIVAANIDELPPITTEEDAEKIAAEISYANTDKSLQIAEPIAYDLAVKSFDDLTLGAQLAMFKHMSTDPTTGITNPAMGIMKYQRAKELGIPWANATSHMHIIKGRVGLDINICQAILQRGKSGITWEYLDEYKALYNYMDANGIQYPEDALPPNAVKVDTLKEVVPVGKMGVILAPTFLNGKMSYLPSDFVTTIRFTRDKKNIKGEWITVGEIGKFKWSDAVRAGLNKPGSNWEMRPAYMIYKSAFWDGAKKIANDLLNGADDVDALNSIPD
jgi:hypothetical protein